MDYYSQRLSEKRKTKEAKMSRMMNLPLGRPTQNNPQNLDSSLKTMAGSPSSVQPEQEPDNRPDSEFKTIFDNLSQDEGFKNGMAEFATIMKTMHKDMQGLNLPKEVMQRKVEQVVNQYMQGSKQLDANNSAMGNMPQQQSNTLGELPNG